MTESSASVSTNRLERTAVSTHSETQHLR
uniref:Uncharacterized protein n=1 Tax=Anguilla anguilla TaxID=7936 RepID=A0A0E9PYD4_ANGAN